MGRKPITDKQQRYIEKKIGDDYNFSNLTSYEAISLINLIEKHDDYNYLIFRNHGIDSKLKAIEEQINANGMKDYKYAGLVRVVGCDKWYPYFEKTIDYENDFWGYTHKFRMYWLGKGKCKCNPIHLLINNDILSESDLLKSYDKETTNLFKRIENLEKLLDGANVKEG